MNSLPIDEKVVKWTLAGNMDTTSIRQNADKFFNFTYLET